MLVMSVGIDRLLMRKLIDYSSAEDHKIACKNRKIDGNINIKRDATNTQQRVRHKIKRPSYFVSSTTK